MVRVYLSWPPPSWSGQGHGNGDTVPDIGAAKTDLFTYWERTIILTNLSTRWITFHSFPPGYSDPCAFYVTACVQPRVRQGFSILWCSLCPRIIILDCRKNLTCMAKEDGSWSL